MYWTGASTTDANWSDPQNWEGSHIPGDDGLADTLVFDTTRPQFAPGGSFSPFNPVNDLFKDLNFNSAFDPGEEIAVSQIQIFDGSSAGDFTISGLPIRLGSGITHTLTNGIATALNLNGIKLMTAGGAAANQTFLTNQGQLNIDTPIDLAGSILTVDGAGNTGMTQVISNSGATTDQLYKYGSGVLTLSNSGNNYDGITRVQDGTLTVTADHALGSTAGGTVVSSGGTLALLGDLDYTTPESLRLSGDGYNAQGALENLTGTSVFAGAITFGGGTISSAAGTLQLDGSFSCGTKKLQVSGAGDVVINGVLSSSSAGSYQPGLFEGYTSGYNNLTGIGVGMDLGPLYPVMGEQSTLSGPLWGTNETWIYRGRYFSANGSDSFAENIDDMCEVVIDGNVVLYNSQPTTPSTTGILNLTPGWHDIEIRFSNNTGNGGAVSDGLPGSWRYFYGFGYSATGSTATTGSSYTVPVDPGDGSLFTYWSGAELFKNGSGTLTFTNSGNSYPGLTHLNGGAIVATPTRPVDTNPATNQITEGAPAGTPVRITASSTRLIGPTITYSLTADSSHGGFQINPSTGVVTVANGALLDYETATSHIITVQAASGSQCSSQSFVIQVVNVNEPPVVSVPGSQTVSAGTVRQRQRRRCDGTANDASGSAWYAHARQHGRPHIYERQQP